MAEDRPLDRTKVSFSQAEGLEPLPGPLKLGDLSQEIRSLIWNIIYKSLNSQLVPGGTLITAPWDQVLFDHHVYAQHKPADEFVPEYYKNVKLIKGYIYNLQYNYLFDFITYILRHPSCPHRLPEAINAALRRGRAAYTVISDGPTIIPAATPEQGETIHRAFGALEKVGFDGARAHLRDSAGALTGGDFAGSVRESIHAVESVARLLDQGSSETLAPALRALSKKSDIHPALHIGFEKIYGYTCDEQGVRHALLEEGAADVDMDDAVFMIGACASFVTYLIGKARQAGLIDE